MTTSTDSATTYDKELTTCPDCNANVTLTSPIESNGNGIAFAPVRCTECGWHGTEEWIHDKTITETE